MEIITRKQQVEIECCSPESVMCHPHFARGLDDIRTGRPFADRIDDPLWAYERGRLFGAIAPLTLPLFVKGRRLNRQAVHLFVRASARGWIL
jgi:hypothetical protein